MHSSRTPLALFWLVADRTDPFHARLPGTRRRSSPNLATVRRLIEAINDRDSETFVAALDPDVELYPLRAQLEGRPYLGHGGARKMLVEIHDDWEDLRIETGELRDAGDEVIYGKTFSQQAEALRTAASSD